MDNLESVKISLEELLDYIGAHNVLQEKYLRNSFQGNLSQKEYQDLLHILQFYMEKHTLEEIGNAYLLFVNDTLEETKFFVEHGKYRYSKLEEVSDSIYFKEDYMQQYMLGLIISGYIWSNHLSIHRWYLEKIKSFSGKKYLEIGPGHGQYFLEAINLQQFEDYVGVDLSPTSQKKALAFIERFKKEGISNYRIICKDFMQMDETEKFDGVSMSEVLEHVENPLEMLKKIYHITNADAKVYITTVINSPTVDHIYLFRTVEEVLKLVKEAGFQVDDYFCATANGIDMEKAVRKKTGINIALILKK